MLYIGTSGWTYSHWQGIFYPDELSKQKWFRFYAQYFNTVEINYSFYHLPSEKTYQNWQEKASDNFIFAIKVSRYISHIKRLKNVKNSWLQFYSRAQLLENNLGPFLLQMPPNFLFNQENFKQLEKVLAENFSNSIKKLKLAIEFRHKSWNNQKIFDLLKKYNVALVISNSSHWQEIIQPNLANFIYIRFHGPRGLFSSKYSSSELKNWAKKIKKWEKNKDIFVYFNNDSNGFALQNAKELKRYLNLGLL